MPLNPIQIEQLKPDTYGLWDDYISKKPDSTCYHHRAWQKVATDAYRIKAPFLMARDEKTGAVRGVLPLFLVKGLVRRHLTNGLFGAYGAVLADDLAAHEAMMQEAEQIFVREKLSYFILKTLHEPKLEIKGLERTDAWVIATLPLLNDTEAMWQALSFKNRNHIRKAQKNGLTLKSGHDQLPHFYDVLADNMHSKGAPIYGLSFMRELMLGFGSNAEILVLWHEGKPISGALLLFHGKTVTIPFSSSRPSMLSLSPNNLLYWEIIQTAIGRGINSLDFGRSLQGSGPLTFKLGWGAKIECQPTFIRTSESGKSLKIDPNHPAAVFFVRQWKRLPRSIVDALGPQVCRQLSGLI